MLNPFRAFMSAVFTTLAIFGSVAVVHASTLVEIQNASYVLHKNNYGICSGQFISPTEFLTASHCVEDMSGLVDKNTPYYIVREERSKDNVVLTRLEVFLDVDRVDQKGDVAILKVRSPTKAFKPVDIANNGPTIGERLYAASFPEIDWGFLFTDGMYSGLFQTNFEDSKSYATSVMTAPGSSGGGLYRKIGEEYFLVGTVQGGPPRHDYMSFFSTLTAVNGIINQ